MYYQLYSEIAFFSKMNTLDFKNNTKVYFYYGTRSVHKQLFLKYIHSDTLTELFTNKLGYMTDRNIHSDRAVYK